MTFGVSGAALAGIAAGGATLVSGYMQSRAAGRAGDAQAAASEAGIAEQRRQFDVIQNLLAPYVGRGTDALGRLDPYEQAGLKAFRQQRAILGMEGRQAQEEMINRIQRSPMFNELIDQGENAILQNASATGGLRGGNVQGALAQFRPTMLNDLINQQYARLGGITQLGQTTTQNIAQMGQASATGTATAAQQTGANISGLLGDIGSARAGQAIAQGKAWNALPSAIGGGFGMFTGLGGKF